MNFAEFMKNKEIQMANESLLMEGFSQKSFKDAWKLIVSLFHKNIKGKVYPCSTPDDTTIDGTKCKSFLVGVVGDGKKIIDRGFSVNFAVNGKSMEPFSVSFYDPDGMRDLWWDDDTPTTHAALDVSMMGASIVYYLPIIYHIMNTGSFELTDEKANEIRKKVYDKKNECYTDEFWVGALKYKILEGISRTKLFEAFKLNNEIREKRARSSYGNIMENELQNKKEQVYKDLKQSRIDGDKELEKKLYKEYRQILDAIKGGATSLGDFEASVQKKVKVTIRQDEKTQDAEVKFQKETKDPKKAFKEMQAYVNAVIKGLQPGCILCGAPGIGKTYRVLQQLKAHKYVNGQNMDIIKGKCTPRQLYLSMYEHQDKGHIIVIDDADALVGPKAPEDVINILKGALDSTTDDEGGRLVSYRVSGELKDDEGTPVPKRMSYKGSVIVITNYSVGQLDTALRGRVFTQSLDFTTKQLLDIIHEIMPAIEPTKLKSTAKIKAFDYLSEMEEKGEDMEISIRTFGTCARLFQICEDDPDLDEEDARSMIKEQMTNMYLRGGKKF